MQIYFVHFFLQILTKRKCSIKSLFLFLAIEHLQLEPVFLLLGKLVRIAILAMWHMANRLLIWPI